MAGYLGSSAVFLSTTAVDIDGDNSVGGNLVVGGTVTAADLNLDDTSPRITLTDTDGTNQWTQIYEGGGNTFYISNNDATKGQHIFQQVASGVYTEAMRINTSGNVQVTNDVIAKNFIGAETNPSITSADADGYLAISGDATVTTGGNMRLFSAAHATNANNIIFRDNAVEALRYDSSASLWNFQASDITTTGTVTTGDVTLDNANPTIVSADADGFLTLSGGTGTVIGTQIRLYGESHATAADDITFRSGNSARLIYNASTPVWNFQAEDIKTTGTIETTGGIYLGGSVAANLMDDYEEGTWTPVVRDAFTAGNLATLTVSEASYTKVGNMVTVWLSLNDIDTTGMTAGNVVYVTGLPFIAATKTGVFRNCGTVETTQIAYTGYLVANVTEGENSIIMRDVRSSAGILSMKVSDVTLTSADLSTTITYETTA